MWASPTLGGDPLKPPKLYGCLGHDYMGGETPQTPLSVIKQETSQIMSFGSNQIITVTIRAANTDKHQSGSLLGQGQLW
jgi:hypothetical protein